MRNQITYVINSNDKDILQQFIERLSKVGIQSKHIKSSDNKYNYFESYWIDSDMPNLQSKNHNLRNAGAKTKQLNHNGIPVTCGFIYELRHKKNLSDAEIASMFGDISESTVARRRKKHLADGNFYDGSNTIF